MLAALSNGNIRVLLELTKRIIVSGHLDTEKIVRKIRETGAYYVPDFEAVRTLLYGDYDHYDPKSSLFVNLLYSLVPVWQGAARTSASENRFSFTRAA
jgi:hypothetical protein